MGGKSRKTGKISKKLIQRLLAEKEIEDKKDKCGRKKTKTKTNSEGFGLIHE